MNHHQFLHLLNSASVLINCRHITITSLHGLWALLGVLDRPTLLDEYFHQHDGIDISFFRGNEEDYVKTSDFLNAAMGKGSAYHDYHGCYLTARTPWDSPLPDGWFQSDSLAYLNVCLRHGKAVSVAPEYHMLLALMNDDHPLLLMQLISLRSISIPKLQDVIKSMQFDPAQRWAINKRLLSLIQSVGADAAETVDQQDQSTHTDRPSNNVVPITMHGAIKKPPKKAVVASSWALND